MVKLTTCGTGQHAGLSILDQGVISASNFLMTVLVGRYGGAEQLGYYSLAFATLICFQVVFEATVWTPGLIFGSRLDDQAFVEYTGKILSLQGGLTFVAVAVVIAITIVFFAVGEDSSLIRVFSILAGVMPFLFLREFIRRTLLARLRIRETLTLDVLTTLLLFGMLALLFTTNSLSAESVLIANGLACTIVCSLWFLVSTFYRSLTFEAPGASLRQHWIFGRWLCGSQIADVIQNYGLSWLIAFNLGAAATGAYNACWSIVLIFNPLVMGVSNVLLPTASQMYLEEGNKALRKVIAQATLVMGAIMAVLSLGLIVAGERLIDMLYANRAFEGHGRLIVLFTLTALIHTIGFAANQGLLVLDRPEINFAFKLFGIVVMIGIAWYGMGFLGVDGAALGRLAGSMIAGLGTVVAFLMITRSVRESVRQ